VGRQGRLDGAVVDCLIRAEGGDEGFGRGGASSNDVGAFSLGDLGGSSALRDLHSVLNGIYDVPESPKHLLHRSHH